MAFFNYFRRQSINVCDVPLITRQTVHIEFEGYVKKKENPSNNEFRQNNSPTTNSEKIKWPNPSTSNPNRFVNGLSTILRRTSFKIEKPVETTTALNPSDFILKSSTTKRQPKVFFTTSTNQIEATGKKFGPGPQNLVDGFIVSGNRNGEENEGKISLCCEEYFHVSNIYFHFFFLTKDDGGKKGTTTEKNNRANENSDEADGDDDEGQDGGDRNDSGRRDTSQELEQVLRNTGPSTVSSVLEVTKYQETTTSNTSVPGVKVAGVRHFTLQNFAELISRKISGSKNRWKLQKFSLDFS